MLIKTVARIMQRAQQDAGEGHVFRMGGDGQKTVAIIQSLRDAFRANNVSVALGHLTCMTPISDIDAIITKVDREMYKDKGRQKR